jgi:RNA polymerase sigma factor (TIGR02999 family)
MGTERKAEVTTVLDRIRAGDSDARGRLAGLVYDELRTIAAGLMGRERHDHTLQPTALVNEAFVRLLEGDALKQAPNRAYFFAAAARSMRQVLVDHARQRKTQKRGGEFARVALDAVLEQFEENHLDVLALDEALKNLAQLNPRQGEVVTLRFFGGLTVAEVAEQLGVSVATVEGDFRKATAFLRGQLS